MPKNVWTEDENVNMMQLEDKEFNRKGQTTRLSLNPFLVHT